VRVLEGPPRFVNAESDAARHSSSSTVGG
jgi:hypothetical protein